MLAVAVVETDAVAVVDMVAVRDTDAVSLRDDVMDAVALDDAD
jgi:hypothetical protein